MTIIGFIVLCVVLGLVVWLLCRLVPMDPTIKNVLVIAVVVILVLVFLQAIGAFGGLDRPIPQIR
jgi:hypothetical protein